MILRLPLAGLAALGLACAAGCAVGASISGHGHVPSRAARTASLAAGPLPPSSVRKLPPGTFYFLWGPVGAEDNLWQASARGGELQLSHNPRGFEIDSFGASRAGIVVSDALHNADQLARWTSHGAQWLRPWHAKGSNIWGFDPDIRPDGQITYDTSSPNAIWLRQSFTGRARVIYRYPAKFLAGAPVFGPRGQVAVVGPAGTYVPKGQRPTVLIVSRHGTIRMLRTGYKRFGYPQVWGQNAPALAVPPWRGAEKLFFSSGRQELLPAGWKALAWSPDGTRLLVLSRTSLGIWSLATRSVRVIGPVNRAPQIVQASWLSAPAR